jgi:hypothetical protein
MPLAVKTVFLAVKTVFCMAVYQKVKNAEGVSCCSLGLI